MGPPLASEHAMGDTPKLLIYERQELIEDVRIAGIVALQKLGDVPGT